MTAERAAVVAEGRALALARFERGQSLTAAERECFALVRDSAAWSINLHVRRLGAGYIVDHPSMQAAGIYRRKLDAVRAWAVMIELWRALVDLEATRDAVAPVLPGEAGAVRTVERAAPVLAEVPFSLSAPVGGGGKGSQGSLF